MLITGAGRAFSSGADLGEQRAGVEGGPPDLSERLRELYNPIILSVRELPKPVLAAVNGPAAGIGCSLALACDLIVAAESAFFLLAFVNIGLVPDGGVDRDASRRAPGAARAAEMAMLGERVPASTALEWGLINRVVPDDELERGRRPAARPARRRPDQGLREHQAAAQPHPLRRTSPSSSTPRPRRSASRAGPLTSSRACSRSRRSGRPGSPEPERPLALRVKRAIGQRAAGSARAPARSPAPRATDLQTA